MAITSANQLELLQTAEAVAREKMIDPVLVSRRWRKASPARPSPATAPRWTSASRSTARPGRATFTRVRTVVADDELENYQAQLTVEQAKQFLDDPKVGDVIVDEVPPVELGRIAAQSAKQVILQKVREAERDRQYEEFKDRVGTIINGQVKREEYGNVIVDVGPARRSCAATRRSAAKAIARTTASAATSRTSAARRAARRSSCRAPRPSSWPSSSRWKCPRSTTASSRSRPWPATRARAPRSPSSATTARSTRSAPASACAAAACRPW
jgi:hypothetical protein